MIGAHATRLLEVSNLCPAVLEETEAPLAFWLFSEFFEKAAHSQRRLLGQRA